MIEYRDSRHLIDAVRVCSSFLSRPNLDPISGGMGKGSREHASNAGEKLQLALSSRKVTYSLSTWRVRYCAMRSMYDKMLYNLIVNARARWGSIGTLYYFKLIRSGGLRSGSGPSIVDKDRVSDYYVCSNLNRQPFSMNPRVRIVFSGRNCKCGSSYRIYLKNQNALQ